ncbi:HIT domain-containing protein [bacterium]|nr:HIT domain-containing protein [bacterium]
MSDSNNIHPDRLWAPWRKEYITKIDPPGGCIFCDLPEEGNDRKNLILHRGETAFVIMNRFPYNNGHLMVVPYHHTAELDELSDSELLELMHLIRQAQAALKKTLKPQGFNVGMNVGRIGGAGIADHLHLHVVPRWNGDTNFMPIIGGTKVISEALESTWEQLTGNFT